MKHYRKIIFAIAAVIIAGAAIIIYCSTRMTSLIIQGQAIGLNSEKIYLERNVGNIRRTIDSVTLSRSGEFKFVINEAASTPTLYELRSEWDIVPIFGQRGEKITINSIGRFALNYLVEGSHESTIIREFYQPYVRNSEALRNIATQYAVAQNSGNEALASENATQYSDVYKQIKQDQIKFIIENKGSLSAIYALSQRLPGDSYLMNEDSDLIYMRTVADSVNVSYPNSLYVKVLNSEIEDIEARKNIMSKVVYRGYPEIEMNDMFGKSVALSSLEGDVILVDFWSAQLGQGNPNNAAMKEIYREFQDRGFEIYQVGIDTSKSTWINSIQQQKLPWISVSDLKGDNTPVLALYNITALPANVLINREGDIVARNIFGDELREAIQKAL